MKCKPKSIRGSKIDALGTDRKWNNTALNGSGDVQKSLAHFDNTSGA